MEMKSGASGGTLVAVPCTMQVISINCVLNKCFSTDGVMKGVLDNIAKLNEHETDIVNIMQGKVWTDIIKKETNSENCLRLPLVLFYDDFETGNPLGSHSSIHKLGGIYLSLPFLHDYHVSQLNNIFIY